MQLRYLPLFLLLLCCCNTPDNEWQLLDFRAFTLTTPKGWKILHERGIDSYVGGLTDGKDSLWFDYGLYGVDLDNENSEFKWATDTINGLKALITVPVGTGKGYIIAEMPKVSELNKFTLWGKDPSSANTILKIFKSLTFPNSDTTKNPPLTEQKFASNTPANYPITILRNNCSSCHSIYKQLTGPALGDVISQRDAKWIYKYLTDSSFAAKNSHQQQNNLHCLIFPNLTEQQVESIYTFIHDYSR